MSESVNRAALSARLHELHAAFNADPDAFVEATIEPTDDDYRIIGKLIQIYCFADYCARRIIDAIREAALGFEARNGSLLQDKQVFPKLREAAAMLWDCEVKNDMTRAAEIIELHREQRHNFAHWAVRRIRDEDAMIILSKHAREGELRHGRKVDPYETNYGFFSPSALIEEMRKMDKHVHVLSLCAYNLETYTDELRIEFDRRSMHKRNNQKR